MSSKANKALVQRYLDALRKDKSQATLDKYIAEDELKQHIAMFEVSFPGYWLEAHDMVAEDDKVFVRATFHGVHAGKLMEIAPTRKIVSAPLYIVYRIADNRIVEHWMLADMFTVLQQIGAAPVPAH